MKWASVFGAGHHFDGTLKNLFKSLDMTYSQGRRGWDMLIANHDESQGKFIEIEPLPAKGRGRPSSRYRLSSKLVKTLQMSPPVSEHHTTEIAKLAETTRLSAENKPEDLVRDGRQRRSKLTLPNRWLLMVLLAHADMPGVITRLGISKIRQLTGMSRSRIDRQLKKLGNLGVIAQHQPGRYSSQASIRKTSLYLLDLAHPLLESFTKNLLKIECLTRSKGARQTELVGGIFDAVMTFAVCNVQTSVLLDGNDAIVDLEDPRLIRKSTRYRPTPSRYEIIERALSNAYVLLPNERSWKVGLEEIFTNYDTDDADWLLTSIHIDACLLLSSSWGDLKNGQLGPKLPSQVIIANTAQRLGLEPKNTKAKCVCHDAKASTYENPQDLHDIDNRSTDVKATYHPLAVLSYALSYHLAKQLQMALSSIQLFEAPAITYMLIPVFSNNSCIQQRPVYELRGYGVSEADATVKREFRIDPVDEDLHSYWRTYHHRCLSAISNKLDDSKSDSPEPAGQ
ncbi:MAG TPA: hypothetical protein ENI10_16755 [Halomonas sp.]|nr:hypothetical protein [Halomonas sp.]HDZ46413.1 hypothetical protein [Halomonas sp.]HEB06213.1 hypothetical protein [Halomonas sp.]